MSLQSWTKADDISDFEIEGVSVGDSLLDFFSEEKIIKEKRNYYKNKDYTPIEINLSNFDKFSDLSFSYKTKDKNYIIERLSGFIDYRNKDIENCLKQVTIVADEIESLFSKDVIRGKKTKDHFKEVDKTGKSYLEYITFDFENGDQIVVACYDFSEESGYTDNFNIELKSSKFRKFLLTAY